MGVILGGYIFLCSVEIIREDDPSLFLLSSQGKRRKAVKLFPHTPFLAHLGRLTRTVLSSPPLIS